MITHSEGSYQVCVCLIVCDLEPSTMRWPGPTLDCGVTERKRCMHVACAAATWQQLSVICKVVSFDTNIIIVDASGWESAASDESDSDEESDSDNDSDGGTANVTPAARIAQPQQKQQGSSRSYKKPGATRKKETPKQYSSAELITLLNEVTAAGNMTWHSEMLVHLH